MKYYSFVSTYIYNNNTTQSSPTDDNTCTQTRTQTRTQMHEQQRPHPPAGGGGGDSLYFTSLHITTLLSPSIIHEKIDFKTIRYVHRVQINANAMLSSLKPSYFLTEHRPGLSWLSAVIAISYFFEATPFIVLELFIAIYYKELAVYVL